MKKLMVFGAGDLGKFLAYNLDLFHESYNLLGFMDEDERKVGGLLCGLPVFGMDYLDANDAGGLHLAIAISSSVAKRSVVKKLEPYGILFPNFIAKGSWLSKGVTLGCGNIIYPNCSVDYETEIGDFVTINAGCTIGHNNGIGSYANLSPGVNLAGFTRIGEGANLGIGCCSRQGIEVGAYGIIGGQAMLIENVASGGLAVGVPAKIKK